MTRLTMGTTKHPIVYSLNVWHLTSFQVTKPILLLLTRSYTMYTDTYTIYDSHVLQTKSKQLQILTWFKPFSLDDIYYDRTEIHQVHISTLSSWYLSGNSPVRNDLWTRLLLLRQYVPYSLFSLTCYTRLVKNENERYHPVRSYKSSQSARLWTCWWYRKYHEYDDQWRCSVYLHAVTYST